MDVTPKLLEDVEFREKFRGYDPEEVDEFLERVSIAFGQLQERVRDLSEQVESANARATRAEARARDSSDTDDTLRRTLVLAQRTADAAIKEAEENAAAIIAAAEAQARQHYAAAEEKATQAGVAADEQSKAKLAEADSQAADKLRQAEAQSEATLANAREQASRLLVDARQKGDKLLAEAETTAVRQAEEKLNRLTDEVARMERRRDALAHDVNALDAHGVVQRERLRTALEQLRSLVEAPAALGDVPLPTLGSTTFDEAVAAHVARAAAPAPAVTDSPAEPATEIISPVAAAAAATTRAPANDAAAADAPAGAAAADRSAGSTAASVFDSSAPAGFGTGAVSTSPFAPSAGRVSRDPGGRDEATPSTGDDSPASADTAADGVTSDAADASDAATTTVEQPAVNLDGGDGATATVTGNGAEAGETTATATADAGAAAADTAAVVAGTADADADKVGDADKAAGDKASTVPPRARAAADRPSMGLGTPGSSPGADAPGGPGAPPWMGMVPPPPPPPPPAGQQAAGAATAEPGDVPPPPPAAPVGTGGPAATTMPAAATGGSRDTFLDELRRAVGEEPADDDAIKFFEDRDPTDPALRFFEGNEEIRSRFRRR